MIYRENCGNAAAFPIDIIKFVDKNFALSASVGRYDKNNLRYEKFYISCHIGKDGDLIEDATGEWYYLKNSFRKLNFSNHVIKKHGNAIHLVADEDAIALRIELKDSKVYLPADYFKFEVCISMVSNIHFYYIDPSVDSITIKLTLLVHKDTIFVNSSDPTGEFLRKLFNNLVVNSV